MKILNTNLSKIAQVSIFCSLSAVVYLIADSSSYQGPLYLACVVQFILVKGNCQVSDSSSQWEWRYQDTAVLTLWSAFW